MKPGDAESSRLDCASGFPRILIVRINWTKPRFLPDIEGAEPLAFQGARRMLREANPPVWLLEINGLLRRFGFTEPQLADMLSDHGFDLPHYDSDRRELEFGSELWRDHDNLLAIARSAREQVAARLEAVPR